MVIYGRNSWLQTPPLKVYGDAYLLPLSLYVALTTFQCYC